MSGLKEVCRACLSADGTLRPLLDSIVPKFLSPPNSIVDLWKIFTKMLTATQDNFTDKICTDCLAEIQRTYFFMLKCERSVDLLKEIKNVEICSNRLENVSTLHENDSSFISQIKNENIEWDKRDNEYDEVDTDRRHFEVIYRNVETEIDPRSQHSQIVKYEDENVGIELLDQLESVDDDTKDEMAVLQDIKQESELDLYTEKSGFDEIEVEHQSSTDTFACPGCLYSCRIIVSLMKHIIDNHMEGQMCKLCNQEFECSTVEHCYKHIPKFTSRKKCLMNPVGCQMGERLFKCEICSKTFTRRDVLTDHFRCHTGERPFKCEICPKTFRRKQYLTEHLQRHAEELPYKCDSCSKAFTRKSNLARHSKNHKAERQFKCAACPK